GEGSGTPTEPHHIPSPVAQTPSHTTQPTSSLPPVSTTSIPTVTPTETTPIQQYTRRARIAQSSALPPVADKPASPVRDVSQGEACLTNSGFIADQDRATIANFSTLPHDSAPRVTSPVADEGKVEILKLKERVKVLEDREGIAATRSGDDAPIKGRSMDEGEVATKRISDDTKEMAMILTYIDAAIVLAGGIDDVPTGSGSIPTAGPSAADIPMGSDVVPTASLVFATATVVTPYSRRKGKEVMVESDTPKKQRLQEQIDAQVARELEEKQEKEDKRMSEQIARDAEVARIHAEEELQSMIDGLDRNNETKAKEDLNQLWILVKEYLSIRPASSDKEMELWVELKRLYEPDPEDQLWTQKQNFMHAPIEWKLYDLSGVHQVTAKDKEIFMLVEKDYPLRKGLALVMICYKLQVENFSQMANDLV
nr:hypothetical protein [Tanacetum cinerariifolium]